MLLDGIDLGDPAYLTVCPKCIGMEERTASGRMVVDVIAYKRQVDCFFELISEDVLRVIMDRLESKVFHQLTYDDPRGNGLTTITAKAEDYDVSLSFSSGGRRYWEKVRLTFVEQ